MNHVVLHSRSGPDKKLHLEVPVDQPNAEFEVVMQIRSKPLVRTLPPDYFNLLGSVDDETLTTHPQPKLPPPVEME